MPVLTQTTITTSRLQLRWMDRADAAATFALFSNPEVTRYWSTPPWTDIAHADAFIEQTLADYSNGSGIRFAVLLQETGEMIGSIKLYDIFASNRRCDLGYALLPSHWGKGYIGEALGAVIDYAFSDLDLNRIEADIDPRNEASAKVLERLAFVKEGYMRERWIVNGEVCDTAFYGLLRREWEAR